MPELARRARGIPVWAVLRSLGRDGVTELIEGLARRARAIADGIAEIDGAATTARLISEGTAWMSGSRWHGRDVLRVSVSNWSTDEEDVRRSVDALRRAAAD